MTIAIVLGKQAIDSHVMLDGHDITTSVRGLEVRAFAGEATRVTLVLSSRVELTGEVGALFKTTDDQVQDVSGQVFRSED
jgi:hypothetical protein